MITDEKEIVKPIRFKDTEKHRDYCLDFSRDTVVFAESLGFDWDLIGTKPATMIPLIWWIAFRRHHPKVSKAEADNILESFGGLNQDILLRLRELYEQSLTSLVNTEDETDPNSRWVVEM